MAKGATPIHLSRASRIHATFGHLGKRSPAAARGSTRTFPRTPQSLLEDAVAKKRSPKSGRQHLSLSGWAITMIALLFVGACGGSQPGATDPSGTRDSKPPGYAERTFSRPILQYSSENESLAWMDGGSLARSEIWERLLNQVGQAGDPFEENKMAEFKESCFFEHLSEVGDVLVSVHEKEKDPLVVVEYQGDPGALGACFRELQKDDAAPVQWTSDPELGGRDVIEDRDFLMVWDPPFLLVGKDNRARAAFAGSRQPRDLDIPPAATFVAEVRLDEPTLESARVVVRTEGDATVFEIRSRLTSTELAKKFATMAEKGQQTALQALQNLSDDQAQMFADSMNMTAEQLRRSGLLSDAQEIVASFSVSQRGPTLEGSFRIPTDQTLDTFLALSIYGIKRYVLRAKQSEAHQMLTRIGTAMLVYHDEHGRLPPSAAPLPAELPPGARYQSNPEDWQKPGWAELEVSLSSPQYYAYEILVAPGGKSFRAYARGDLDGDGIKSEISLGGAIEQKDGKAILVLEKELTEVRGEE